MHEDILDKGVKASLLCQVYYVKYYEELTMEIDNSPFSFGLPHEHWRPYQNEVISWLSRTRKGVYILEAPTGFGKSAVAAAISTIRDTTVITISTDLQIQYAEAYGFSLVWGRARYPCTNPDRVKRWVDRYGEQYNQHSVREPTVDRCPLPTTDRCPSCPYHQARKNAQRNSRLVLNLHYAALSRWWRERPCLFLDEAHRAADTLSSLLSFHFSHRTRQRFSLPPWPQAQGHAVWAHRAVAAWLEHSSSLLQAQLRSIPDSDEKMRHYLKRLSVRFSKLSSSLGSCPPGSYYISIRNNELHISPVDVSTAIQPLLRPLTVLMSATIGDPGQLARELGLSSFQFRSIPHPFPPEIRPVFFYTQSAPLGHRSQEQEWRHNASIITHILNQHPAEKGIIHVASWKQVQTLARFLPSERLFIPQPPRSRAVRQFRQSPQPLVALSPSWREGLDFPNDQARFSIIAKIPFADLSDPITRLRKERYGWPWYLWKAALGVVQAAGRIVRSEDDYGTSYITDGHWTRVRSYAPQWFTVQDI